MRILELSPMMRVHELSLPDGVNHIEVSVSDVCTDVRGVMSILKMRAFEAEDVRQPELIETEKVTVEEVHQPENSGS
jgi:hypothetical protein